MEGILFLIFVCIGIALILYRRAKKKSRRAQKTYGRSYTQAASIKNRGSRRKRRGHGSGHKDGYETESDNDSGGDSDGGGDGD